MATIAELLDEARAAHHALITGKSPRVVVDGNGERVEFTAARRGDLYNYIQDLERQLGASTGAPLTRGPAGFLF